MYYRSGCSLLAFLLGVAVAISTVTAETDVSSSESVDSTEGEHRGLRGSFGWSPRIINGDIVTDPSKYPYYALMTIRSVNSGEGRCGGALIGPKFVLTAAHCVSPGATDTFDIGVIRAGDFASKLSSFSKPSGTSYGVKEFKMHPAYDKSQNHANDIAVYELDRPVTGVQYIKLGKTPVSEAGKDLTVIGMGTTEHGTMSDRLKKTTVDYLTNSDCSDSYTEHVVKSASPQELMIQHNMTMAEVNLFLANYRHIIPDYQLCTYRDKTGFCQGDSGGPLVIETGSASTHELVGVVSGNMGKSNCNTNNLNVYARVSVFYDWIVDTMCAMNPEGVPSDFSCFVGPDDTSGIGTIEPSTEGSEDENDGFITKKREEIKGLFDN